MKRKRLRPNPKVLEVVKLIFRTGEPIHFELSHATPGQWAEVYLTALEEHLTREFINGTRPEPVRVILEVCGGGRFRYLPFSSMPDQPTVKSVLPDHYSR